MNCQDQDLDIPIDAFVSCNNDSTCTSPSDGDEPASLKTEDLTVDDGIRKISSGGGNNVVFFTGAPNAPMKKRNTSSRLLARLSFLNLTAAVRKESSRKKSERLSLFRTILSHSDKRSSTSVAEAAAAGLSTIGNDRRDNNNHNHNNSVLPKMQQQQLDTNIRFPDQNNVTDLVTSLVRTPKDAKEMKLRDYVSKLKPHSSFEQKRYSEDTNSNLSNVSSKRDDDLDSSSIEMLISRVGDIATAETIKLISAAANAYASSGDEVLESLKTPSSSNFRKSFGGRLLSFRSSTTANSQSEPSLSPKFRSGSLDSPAPSVGGTTGEISSLTYLFSGIKKPKIPLDRYLCRIVRYLNSYHEHVPSMNSVGIRALLVATLYIDRFRHSHPGFVVSSMNIHRLFMIAMLVAVKVAEDDHPSNEYMAGVGGLDLAELNELEVSFCVAINFSVHISLIELEELYTSYDVGPKSMIKPPEKVIEKPQTNSAATNDNNIIVNAASF